MYLDAFKYFNPIVGDKIYVEGIIGNNTINEIEPFKVKKEGAEYFDKDIFKKYKSIFQKKYNLELSVAEIKGKINSIDDSFKDKGFDYYKRDVLWNEAYKYWLYNSDKITKNRYRIS